MKRIFVTIMCAFLALPAMAQEDALKGLPGFVDFGELNSIYGEPKVNISIGGALLRFVGAMAQHEEPEAAAIFSKLKGVRVNVYATDGDASAALDQVASVKSRLSGSNWQPVVQVNEDGEQVQIFMNFEGDVMNGLTLMAVDDEEAVFINVIGQLDPEELSQLMDNFDVDIGDSMHIDVN
ncbi:MAG: DUF4252 domain-containing protein [Xanthomonadales bacterium]|nr:DUF4252 domain-containing protein [Gammaproteobacteria bacterium]NNE04878.1 DUF4252 domain-containing protein [Xanthomonadales bacterium]NNL95769.1 DUF4252 domain-containing protein [Xanthomonadales bacterium]